MDEGVPCIRRRVSVRKRNRASVPIPGASRAAPRSLQCDGEDAEKDEEEERTAGRRRRKPLGVLGAEPVDSEEDMFGDYDSFAENSLAQMDDVEQKYMQFPEHSNLATDFATEELHSESIKNKLSIPTESNSTEYKTKTQHEHEGVPVEPSDDLLYDMPSSQILFFENLWNSSNELDAPSTKERDNNTSSNNTVNEELPPGHIDQPWQNDEFSSKVRTSSDRSRRKSIKDHLKSAMTGNATVQTPMFSKSKQLKETLLSEEINVAMKTIESSSYDLGPFYSLPSKVRDLYVQFRGIEKLYGNAFC